MIDNMKAIKNPNERTFHLEDRGGNLLFLQELLTLKRFSSNDRILEIGCGTGILAYYFKNIKGVTVYGTEISETAFDIAKHRINCFHVVDGSIPQSLNELDLIYCKDVLPMIMRKYSFYKEILESLSDDGIFCTYMPSFSDIINKPILKYIPNSIEKSIESYSSIEENCNFLKMAGFSLVETKEIDLGEVNIDSNYCKKHMDGFFSNTDKETNPMNRYSKLKNFEQSILELNSKGLNLSYIWKRTLITAYK